MSRRGADRLGYARTLRRHSKSFHWFSPIQRVARASVDAMTAGLTLVAPMLASACAIASYRDAIAELVPLFDAAAGRAELDGQHSG